MSDGDREDVHVATEDEKAALEQIRRLLEELKLNNEVGATKITRQNQKNITRVTFGADNAGFQLDSNNGSISGFTFGRPTT